MKFSASFARQKLRFDLGQSFLAIVNFAFIIIAASDKLATLTHLSATATVVLLVPVTIFGIWLFGYVMDRMAFLDAYQDEVNRRNSMLSEVHRNSHVNHAN